MRMSDNPKIKGLIWFLDFLNDDLDNISDLDLSKRVLEVQHYCMTAWFHNDHSFIRPEQKIWNLPVDRDSWITKLHSLQADLRELVNEIVQYQSWEYAVINVGKTDLRLIINSDSITLGFSPSDPVSVFQNEEYLKNAARVSLFFLIDGLPKGSIKSCKECGRYFLHLSKKSRYFCSSKCGSRYANRERRQADPTAYKEKQKKLMWKRYPETVAKKQGKSSDKVKVRRRVYHEEEESS